MKVLVVGAAGFLGHHVVWGLIGDHEVIAYDNLTYADEYTEPVEFIRGDVRDRKTLAEALHKVDAVVWLAAIVGDAACQIDPKASIDINQKAVEFLADEFHGPIIFTSSCSAYGLSDAIANESSPLAPQSLYAETKIAAEQALGRKAKALVLRLGTLHGESKRIRFDLVVNRMTMCAASEGRLDVYGGKQYRPLLSVQDAAGFICEHVDGCWPSGIYNLASENLSIVEVAERVQKIVPCEIQTSASKYEDNRNYRVDCSKAQGIGFQPAYTIDNSIQDIADLIHQGRIRDVNASRYSNQLALQKGLN